MRDSSNIIKGTFLPNLKVDDVSETKLWKWNIIRYISMRHTQIWHHFSIAAKHQHISMTFLISIFQFHWKSEPQQVKWNKVKRDICKSDSTFPYLQSTIVFERLLNLFLDKDLSILIIKYIKEKVIKSKIVNLQMRKNEQKSKKQKK